MSRSSYCDDMDDSWAYICWRGQVASSIRGRCGQKFLQEMVSVLEKLPEKRLIKNHLQKDGEHCALGVVGASRNLNMDFLDPDSYEMVA